MVKNILGAALISVVFAGSLFMTGCGKDKTTDDSMSDNMEKPMEDSMSDSMSDNMEKPMEDSMSDGK